MIQSSNHKLVLRTGTAASQEFALTRPEIIIGRDASADLTLSFPGVSRRHARLMREGEVYTLEDLGSSNGTYLNGERLIKRSPLKSGDQIRLGAAITLTYEAPASAVKEAVEAIVRSAPAIPSSALQTRLGEAPELQVRPRRLRRPPHQSSSFPSLAAVHEPIF